MTGPRFTLVDRPCKKCRKPTPTRSSVVICDECKHAPKERPPSKYPRQRPCVICGNDFTLQNCEERRNKRCPACKARNLRRSTVIRLCKECNQPLPRDTQRKYHPECKRKRHRAAQKVVKARITEAIRKLPDFAEVKFDPCPDPLRTGMVLRKAELHHMLEYGSFAPGTVLEDKSTRYRVVGEKPQKLERVL